MSDATAVAPSAPAKAGAAAPKASESGDNTAPAQDAAEKPTAADVEMKDAPEAVAANPSAEEGASTLDAGPADDAGETATGAEAAAVTSSAKPKAQRKSTGPKEAKGKKLNKKSSKARILHVDAQPGDYFFIKLKGYPPWPGIVCDEDMLPASLIRSWPVSAMRDGKYREDFADGGKRVSDRSFPVMYLHTNEFGWVSNSDLVDLDPEKVLELVNDRMRKDLAAAHEIAAQQHPLEYFKGILQEYQDEQLAKAQEKQAKAEAAAAKKLHKNAPAKAAADEEEDVEMEDGAEPEPAKEKKSAKKRKAEEAANTPQRSDSVKKPKIKINNTPKSATNGAPTPKSGKGQSEPKSAKGKSKKKEADDKKADKEVSAPKEPELSPEERRERKQKEVLFLRHKLQKGLLTRDQEPKEEEMKTMSEYVSKLESFPDLEVSIIRATKINKVLKAILKLDSIPKEDEFKFKPRSQALLEQWNKLLAVDGTPISAGPAGPTNGINGLSAEAADKKESAAETNGAKEDGDNDDEPAATDAKTDVKSSEAKSEAEAKDEKTVPDDTTKAAEVVESTA